MNASKVLVTSIAALSVVGAIGFANAQSNAPAVTQPAAQGQNANTNNALPGSSTTGNAVNNSAPSTTDSTLQRNADLPAQADRN